MKKITTFLLMLLMVTFGFSQNVPVDFEAGGNGAGFTWNVFENDANPALEIISNPVSGGINTSATVAKYTVLPAAGNFAGTETAFGDFGTWTVTDQNAYVKVMVYQVGFNSSVGVKFSNNGAALVEAVRAVPVSDEWVELTFDMSAWIGNVNNPPNQFIFFVDLGGERGVEERVVYFDNVTFNPVPAPTCDDGIQNGDETGVDCGGSSCQECPPPPMPTTAAPTPTLDASNVTNIFSDTYGPNTATGANNAVWEKKPPSNYATYASVTLPGSSPDDYLHYYSGASTVYMSWDPVDTSERSFLNLSVWSANATFGVFLIQSANSPAQGAANVNIIPNQWNQVEIAIPTESDLYFQLVLDALGNKDIYLDNVYFSSVSTLSNDSFSKAEFKAYPNPSKGEWNIQTTENMKTVQVFNITGRLVKEVNVNASKAVINTNGLSRGVYLAKISNEANQTKTIKLIKE